MIAGLADLVSALQEHVLEGQGWLSGFAQAEPEPMGLSNSAPSGPHGGHAGGS